MRTSLACLLLALCSPAAWAQDRSLDGPDAGGGSCGGTPPPNYKVDYAMSKVWNSGKKVWSNWGGPDNADYCIITAYYADGNIKSEDFFSGKHRGVKVVKHKGKPCFYDPRGKSEEERGYRYMWFFQVKGDKLTQAQTKFNELKAEKTDGCAKLDLPSMKGK
jgi:hypothetical protein